MSGLTVDLTTAIEEVLVRHGLAEQLDAVVQGALSRLHAPQHDLDEFIAQLCALFVAVEVSA